MFLKYMSSSRGCGRWLDRRKLSLPAVREGFFPSLGANYVYHSMYIFSVWGIT